MKKLIIREYQGRFHLQHFGPSYAGLDGKTAFSLVIESKARGIHLEFPEVTIFDLFTRFDLRQPEFLGERFASHDFVRLSEEVNEWVVEAGSGTLYDFFKERVASGRCHLEGAKPISFYWRGTREAERAQVQKREIA